MKFKNPTRREQTIRQVLKSVLSVTSLSSSDKENEEVSILDGVRAWGEADLHGGYISVPCGRKLTDYKAQHKRICRRSEVDTKKSEPKKSVEPQVEKRIKKSVAFLDNTPKDTRRITFKTEFDSPKGSKDETGITSANGEKGHKKSNNALSPANKKGSSGEVNKRDSMESKSSTVTQKSSREEIEAFEEHKRLRRGTESLEVGKRRSRRGTESSKVGQRGYGKESDLSEVELRRSQEESLPSEVGHRRSKGGPESSDVETKRSRKETESAEDGQRRSREVSESGQRSRRESEVGQRRSKEVSEAGQRSRAGSEDGGKRSREGSEVGQRRSKEVSEDGQRRSKEVSEDGQRRSREGSEVGQRRSKEVSEDGQRRSREGSEDEQRRSREGSEVGQRRSIGESEDGQRRSREVSEGGQRRSKEGSEVGQSRFRKPIASSVSRGSTRGNEVHDLIQSRSRRRTKSMFGTKGTTDESVSSEVGQTRSRKSETAKVGESKFGRENVLFESDQRESQSQNREFYIEMNDLEKETDLESGKSEFGKEQSSSECESSRDYSMEVTEHPINGDFKVDELRKLRKVKVVEEDGTEKTVTIEIISLNLVKEWLGGFRDKKTQKVFHNAQTYTQFTTSLRDFSRNQEVQAPGPNISVGTQSSKTKATQMTVAGFYMDPITDRYLIPKPYKAMDDQFSLEDKINNAIVIQRWYRKMIARRKLREKFLSIIEMLMQRKDLIKTLDDFYKAFEYENLFKVTHPFAKNDFFMLHSVIYDWWKTNIKELEDINNRAQRIGEVHKLVLDKIAKLFALETQRIKSKEESLNRIQLKRLENTSKPIVRRGGKAMTTIESLPIQRAREIKEIFVIYKRGDLTRENRLDVLLSLKRIVESFENFEHAHEFVKNIEDEIDLIKLGVPNHLMEGLRKRGQDWFMLFVKSWDFNPASKDYRSVSFPKVKQHPSQRCKGCFKLKSINGYPIHVRLRCINICKSCQWLVETGSGDLVNLAPYDYILRLLRAQEALKCTSSVYSSLLQPWGIYHIVKCIWNGHSALSESNYTNELRLTRWDQSEEWSPWNTILLTQQESLIHEMISSNHKVYSEEFIRSVKLKHLWSKMTFQLILHTQEFLKDTMIFDSGLCGYHFTHPIWWRKTLDVPDYVFDKPPFKRSYFDETCYNVK